jgi:hypothetical protein
VLLGTVCVVLCFRAYGVGEGMTVKGLRGENEEEAVRGVR